MVTRRQFSGSATGIALLACLSNIPAFALALESIKVLVGYAPGGAVDLVSRSVASKMSASSYVRGAVIVDNRSGAGGQIACSALKAAPPDGATLLCSALSCTAIYPHVYKNLPYDALTDFVTVTTAASFPLGLAVGPAVPASVKSLADYLAWVRADVKARGVFGNAAAGSTSHFVGALMALDAGLNMTTVAYRGSAPEIADLLGGQIPAILTGTGDLLSYAKSGKLRVLATSGAARDPFLPEVPTYAEQGFPQVVVEEVIGFYAPAKTPRGMLFAANEVINLALKNPDVIRSMAGIGLTAKGSTPEAMDRLLRSEHSRWGPLIKRIGFTAES